MKPGWLIFAPLAAVITVVAIYRSTTTIQGGPDYVALTAEVMASPITVVAPTARAAEAAEIVFGVFRQIDAEMSEWKPGSPLAAVNDAAGRHPVPVPDDLRRLIRRGIEIGDRTDGAFAVSWAALWSLWDFRADAPRVPEAAEIAARITLVDDTAIIVDDVAGTVFLPRATMALGLGGIAKGHALDEAAAALRSRGIDSFLISAAGQVLTGGRRGDRAWRVGIRDPRGRADDHFADLELEDASISTSGDYERYFVVDGVRYHHILDPRTGWPRRDLRSVSVITTDATLGDALSTALMNLAPVQALSIADSWPGVEAVLVDAEGRVTTTTGIADRLEILHPPIQADR